MQTALYKLHALRRIRKDLTLEKARVRKYLTLEKARALRTVFVDSQFKGTNSDLKISVYVLIHIK